jgi:hypothetical protein
MLELICGLVGIVIVISMLLQINMISQKHIFSVARARTAMANKLTKGWYSPGSAPFLDDWEKGADEHNYSEDDVAKTGDPGGFQSQLWEAIKGEELKVWSPYSRATDYNRFNDVCDAFSGGVVGSFGLTMVEEDFYEPVEVLPLVRRLIYGQEEIDIKHRIYMPLINNVMN